MNRRDRRANGQRGRVVDAEPVGLIVDHLRLIGCVCDPPGVHFNTGPMRYGELGSISVAHDDWCPLAASFADGRRSALIVMPPDDQEAQRA